jgi:hypothetical protein
MKRWAVLTFCFASVVCGAWGQTIEKVAAPEGHASVLSAYRKACLAPANADTVMNFDSLSVLYLAQKPWICPGSRDEMHRATHARRIHVESHR